MRYRYIDLVRGLAALAVLVWHYQHFYYPQAGIGMPAGMRTSQPLYDILWPLYLHGGRAVELFWAVSGFVFAATYLSRPASASDYLVNRIGRLYPLHAATLVLVALLQAWSWSALGHFQIYPKNDTYHFVLNALFVQWWGWQEGFSFNAPTWSVSVEMPIYAAFFASIPLLKRSALLGSAVGIGAGAALVAAGVTNPIVTCGLFFYLGTAGWASIQRAPRASVVIGALAIAGFCLLRYSHRGGLTLTEMVLLFGGIILVVGAFDVMAPMRSSRHDWFGNTTYGTYLLHVPIQITVLTVAQIAGFASVPYVDSPLFLLAFVAATLGCAVVSYRAFERPANTWLRERFRVSPHVSRETVQA